MIQNIPEGSGLTGLGRFSIGRILTYTPVCREWYVWLDLGGRRFFGAAGFATATGKWWVRGRTWR